MRFILPLLVLFLSACSVETNSENAAIFSDISQSGWAYGDTVKFSAPTDSFACCKLAVAVRHSSAYKYANLWLEVSVDENDTCLVDTLNVVLADKYGRRTGRGFGVSFIKIDTLPHIYNMTDSSRIFLRHIMRVDTVSDLEQIGIIALD